MALPALQAHHHAGYPGDRGLRVLTWNIQAATATARYHHYATHAWKQVLPHAGRRDVLDGIAGIAADYDVVGLQEVDAGSLRSGFVNQARYVAERAGFGFWHQQVNRRVGNIAHASNGLLSRFAPEAVAEHRLPGAIPGRGALWVRYGSDTDALVVVVVHLALGRRARDQQLAAIAAGLARWPNALLMGDFNAPLDSPEMRAFLDATGLLAPEQKLRTFPSWRPQRALDHILLSPSLEMRDLRVLDSALSDHRPLAMTVRMPGEARLAR